MDLEDRLDQIDCLGVPGDCSHDLSDRQSPEELGACRRRQTQDCQKDLWDRDPEDRDLFHQCCQSLDGVVRPWDEAVCSSRKGPRSLEEPVLREENEAQAEREDHGRGEDERVVGDRHVEDRHELWRALWQAVGQM